MFYDKDFIVVLLLFYYRYPKQMQNNVVACMLTLHKQDLEYLFQSYVSELQYPLPVFLLQQVSSTG